MTDVPDSLRGRIVDAVKGGNVSEQLQNAGEELMLEAKSASPNRDSAMTLLAADALITFAQEAMAELDSETQAESR
jgi:hypothetical protein